MKKRYRFFIVLVVMALCFAFLYPTIKWYFFVPGDEQSLALGTREHIRDYARRTALLDMERINASGDGDIPQGMEYLVAEAKRVNKMLGRPNPEKWTLGELRQTLSRAEVEEAVETMHRDRILKLKRNQQNAVQLGLDLSGGLSIVLQGDMDAAAEQFQTQYERPPTVEERDQIFSQTLEALNGRIDRFGLTEPVIRRQGPDQIYVEIPGAQDPEKIRDILRESGGLTFREVDVEASSAFAEYHRANPSVIPNADGTLPVPVPGIGDDALVFGNYLKDRYGLDELNRNNPYVAVKKEVGLDGSHIQRAIPQRDSRTREPEVLFYLDSQGGELFNQFTTPLVQKPMAIVLDNRIKSVATINEPLRDSVRLTGLNDDEANNIAATLRTAALPVKLEVVNQQSIGPSLGADYINQGLYALLGGLAVVMVFMLLYYRSAGINAIVAQVLNIYLMFSILSAFRYTLTLPSIAGFILTIGMAVDANVIIFERMKEELRLGKGRRAAVDAGFDKAFWAIMDSNITTFIAALFLSKLGKGPIQGFAVSLAIGVFSSVFTALFVSRLIFDFGTDVLKSKKLRVSWFIREDAGETKGGRAGETKGALGAGRA
ncbi:MAG: protein translocase subunit SecD [Treponema sp.]|jgi:preprotein translocase subunit SecD|nr:protein translocase subunit SecD [Treponema sp.]